VKKALVIAGAVVAAIVLSVGSFVAFAMLRGGLPASAADRVPLLGRLLAAPQPPEALAGTPQEQAAAQLPAGREVPFLRFGPEAKLQRLAQELEAKRAEYETTQRELQRRSRELDAWERQLQEERDNLRATLGKEKSELAQLRDELGRKETDLSARQVLIEQTEEANLKKTAEIYGKMTPERAAEILTQMYSSGQQDTVVKIIYLMQDRGAAKTLEAIADAKIGAAITEKLKQIGKTVPQGG